MGCGYGMKAGDVDPYLALLIRYATSALVYIFVVSPILGGGFVDAAIGIAAIFSYTPCWILLAVTAFVGMVSFLCWYTAIDNIGASKALCLNVTYAFWSVFLTLLLSIFLTLTTLSSVSTTFSLLVRYFASLVTNL